MQKTLKVKTDCVNPEEMLGTANGVQARWLGYARRAHFSHGPIDLIIQADGEQSACLVAFDAALHCFNHVLHDLVAELPLLRTAIQVQSAELPVLDELQEQGFNAGQASDEQLGLDGVERLQADPCTTVQGIIAKNMLDAVKPFTQQPIAVPFVTPMAAVAGAVADHVLQAMLLSTSTGLARVSVNNGGDIALHLGSGEHYTVGIYSNYTGTQQPSVCRIESHSPVRGVATSGWRGRSFSLGIADAVTVLAKSAAYADVAATLIANQVNVQRPECIQREPAVELSPDSDLGPIPVTVAVADLPEADKHLAVEAGLAYAEGLLKCGLVAGVWVSLQGVHKSVV